MSAFLQSSRGKTWIPKSIEPLQLPVTVPVATPMFGKKKSILHGMWHLALWKLFRQKTGTESRTLPRIFGSNHGCICHLCVFQKFRRIKPNRLVTMCPRYKEACSMLLSSDWKNLLVISGVFCPEAELGDCVLGHYLWNYCTYSKRKS